jgi:AraC-like DNA-binding protein
VLRIDQRIQISRREIGTDVSGPACIYAFVEVRKGGVSYLQCEREISAPGYFAIFLPPFSLVQAKLENCDLRTSGVAFRPPPHSALPAEPVLLRGTAGPPPASADEIVGRLRAVEGAVGVARAPNASPWALRTKRILDAEYGTSLTIARIAQRVHVSPETLSRAFKHAFGIPPVRYRHHVRIMDALMRFAEGAVPIDVFQDVGFDDLSRFYKIFRKVACAAPGRYRPPRSRNAKT